MLYQNLKKRKYHYDFYPEFKNREEEDHELYGLMSTYIIPLQYKYYILEHYWPEDEKVSVAWPNFYNFGDLNFEFKFIYEDYKVLWPNYQKFIHTRELFYNDKLYDSKILQFYFYKMKNFIKGIAISLLRWYYIKVAERVLEKMFQENIDSTGVWW